jgi:hypothetical protein
MFFADDYDMYQAVDNKQSNIDVVVKPRAIELDWGKKRPSNSN